MRKLHIAVVLLSLLILLSAAACGAQSGSTEGGSEKTKTEPLTGSAEDFERARFDDPTHIDNKWLPLKPGTQLILEGSAIVDEGGRQTRRVVTTVTDLSKVIDGVRTLVIWERDYTAGQLSEPELAFFAQDNAGNVWLVGEYPEEYENGKFDKAPAWISGQKGARAGITMPAEPRQGAPDYAQGFALPLSATRTFWLQRSSTRMSRAPSSSSTTRQAWAMFGSAGGVKKRKRKRPWNWWSSITSARRPWRRFGRRRWKWMGGPTSAVRSTVRRHRHSTRSGETVILRQSLPRASDSEGWAGDPGRAASP
jgi:hypothetical protein